MARLEEPTIVLLGRRHGWPTIHRSHVALGARSGIRLGANPQGPLDPGSTDETLGGLTLPRWLAVAPDGLVLLLDSERLLVFEPSTQRFETVPGIGGSGSDARAFRNPAAIAASRGGLYVADTGNRRVHLFALPGYALRSVWGPWDAAGRPVSADDATAWEPVDLVADGSAAYVLDRPYGRVYRHRAGTDAPELLVAEPEAAGRWTRLAVDRDGRIHLLDPARGVFDVFDRDGRAESAPEEPGDIRDRFDRPAIRVDHRHRFCLPAGLAVECGRRPPDEPPLPERPLALCPPGLVFDRHGRPGMVGEAEAAGPPLYAATGRWIGGPRSPDDGGPLDSEIERCQWHRLDLELELPPGTALSFRTFTDDRLRPPAEIDALPDELWSPEVSATGRLERPGEETLERSDDFLVQSREGRYLWLRIDLRGDGYSTPSVRTVRVHYPRESYLEYLPAVYRTDDESRSFLERFLSLAQTEWDDLEARVERLAAYFDPKAVPAGPFLDELAGWLGLPLEGAWSGEQRRRLLEAAPAFYPRRGTAAAVREHLRITLENEVGRRLATEGLPEIVEGYRARAHLMLSLDEHGRLGHGAPLWSLARVGRLRLDVFSRAGEARLVSTGDPQRDLFHEYAHRFQVFVPAGWVRTLEQERRVRRALDAEKPAHAAYDLCLVEPRFRVGVQATVGLDTVVGAIPSAYLACTHDTDEASSLPPRRRLGYDTVLDRPPDERPPLQVGRSARVGLTTTLT